MEEVLGEWKLVILIGITYNKITRELIIHYMSWTSQERYDKIFNVEYATDAILTYFS